MKNISLIRMKDIAKKNYGIERFLNRGINKIGSLFIGISKKAAKSLHTGQWRSYVFVIFYTIMVFGMICFWTVKF